MRKHKIPIFKIEIHCYFIWWFMYTCDSMKYSAAISYVQMDLWWDNFSFNRFLRIFLLAIRYAPPLNMYCDIICKFIQHFEFAWEKMFILKCHMLICHVKHTIWAKLLFCVEKIFSPFISNINNVSKCKLWNEKYIFTDRQN